jgi:NTP pyrophosphatase (non-canonical NTP hydrolase)
MTPEQFLKAVLDEYERANEKYDQFTNNHEGYGVIKEEVDELWDEIKKNKGLKPNRWMKEEAVQVAAMCLKFCNR